MFPPVNINNKTIRYIVEKFSGVKMMIILNLLGPLPLAWAQLVKLKNIQVFMLKEDRKISYVPSETRVNFTNTQICGTLNTKIKATWLVFLNHKMQKPGKYWIKSNIDFSEIHRSDVANQQIATTTGGAASRNGGKKAKISSLQSTSGAVRKKRRTGSKTA